MNHLSYTQHIPVKYEVDLCVVGAGPAGFAAAVCAARQGLSVFLAEGHGFFGGAATAAMVPAFMPFGDGVHFYAGGFGREIYDRCLAEGFYLFEGSGIMGLHTEKYKRILDNIALAEPNLTFRFFTTFVDVLKENDRVTHCLFAAKSGLFAVKAPLVIDASGDGDVCARAGAPFELGDATGPLMPSTLCSLWVDVDFSRAVNQRARLEEAISDGVFTQHDRHLTGITRTGETFGGGNIGHCYDIDGTDEASLTTGMLTGRRLIPEYEQYYQKYAQNGYTRANVALTAPYLGVRESRRIIGDYVLSEADYRSRARFTDEIGVFSYPIDIHPQPNQESQAQFVQEYEFQQYQKGEFYGIPYRALLPQQIQNMWVAGRCISTDRKMQASIRTMPACFIMGQAAGIAAAIAAEAGTTPRGVALPLLQSRLKKIGAFLP